MVTSTSFMNLDVSFIIKGTKNVFPLTVTFKLFTVMIAENYSSVNKLFTVILAENYIFVNSWM